MSSGVYASKIIMVSIIIIHFTGIELALTMRLQDTYLFWAVLIWSRNTWITQAKSMTKR